MSKQETVANILKRLEERRPALFENYSPAILRLHRIHYHLHQNLVQIIEKYDLQHFKFIALMGTSVPVSFLRELERLIPSAVALQG